MIIVDEFTGRLMPGRRWSDGLHQAVEAKEGVKIEAENQTLATITLQNYFRMYEKLAGMTGTAETEADEFAQIYKLDVVVIPTNQPMIRADNPDVIYRTEKEKWKAVVEEIVELHEKGQPVLVGTVSIEKSETLSELLKRRGIPHVVLNAKYHEREAEIVAQAGPLRRRDHRHQHGGPRHRHHPGRQPGRAGQGRGRPAQGAGGLRSGARAATRCSAPRSGRRCSQAGGLHILGTERHEARRIDNQLRGRSGRQGDPGSSRFFLSLEDDLMRIFASDRLREWMKHLGMEEGVPIESGMVTRSIERAQKQVEGRNFEIRKHLLEYDDVMNKQREAVYRLRRDVLEGKEGREWVLRAAREIVGSLIDIILPRRTSTPTSGSARRWSASSRSSSASRSRTPTSAGTASRGPKLEEALIATVEQRFEERERTIGADNFRQLERYLILSVLDAQWKDHLLALDHLKEGIGMRAYGQRDPAGRVQARVVRALPGDDGARRGPGRPVPVPGRAGPAARRSGGGSQVPGAREQGGGHGPAGRAPGGAALPDRRAPHHGAPLRPPRSGATIPARAAPARSTRSATAPWTRPPRRNASHQRAEPFVGYLARPGGRRRRQRRKTATASQSYNTRRRSAWSRRFETGSSRRSAAAARTWHPPSLSRS